MLSQVVLAEMELDVEGFQFVFAIPLFFNLQFYFNLLTFSIEF